MIHHLTAAERQQLTEANRLLTSITEAHAVCCDCGLCDARMLSDVQDEESMHVPCDHEPDCDCAYCAGVRSGEIVDVEPLGCEHCPADGGACIVYGAE